MTQIRPRISQEEYEMILSYRNGNGAVKLEYAALPKILVLDIETAPIKASVWNIWKQNINLDFIESDWFCICWAAKWLNDDSILSDCVTSDEIKIEDDKRIMKNLWDVIDEADIIVAHNGLAFDIPKVNTRFLFHGLNPPSHYQVIDTLSVIKKEFAITSNKLDYVNQWLGLEKKIKTDANLWVRCVSGEQEALDYMLEYNERDVEILERNYIRIRGWIKNHPNIGTYTDSEESQCPNCGSHSITWNGKNKHTKVGRYSAFRCNTCGYTGHKRMTNLSKEKRAALVR